jgi:hypothetical protein
MWIGRSIGPIIDDPFSSATPLARRGRTAAPKGSLICVSHEQSFVPRQ